MKKRIRINTSIILLENEVITVLRKGEEVRTVNTNGEDEITKFMAECTTETMYHIEK